MFVIHLQLMKEKYNAQSGTRTRACCVAGGILTTTPTLVHWIQAKTAI